MAFLIFPTLVPVKYSRVWVMSSSGRHLLLPPWPRNSQATMSLDKQIDLTSGFVTTTALLCQYIIVNKQM